MTVDGSDRGLIGVLPMGLAAPADRRGLPESVADEAHESLGRLALDLQGAAAYAESWELGAAARGAPRGWAYALAGQLASVGEQLALAHAAAVEVALWRVHRMAAHEDAADEMRMRAMAEAQALFVIGAGHASANVGLRALAMRQDVRAYLISRFTRGRSAPTFAPFSDASRDWVSLNRETCKTLRDAARASGSLRVEQLIEAVVAFGFDRSWTELQARRGEGFHRWRPQSHGMHGVSRATPWTRSEDASALNLSRRAYEEADGLADQAAKLATDAMLKLARAMRSFMDRWPSASDDLGGPRFVIARQSEER